jgi:two-component system cell cycle sensor histidine kinase/response regulator CckA
VDDESGVRAITTSLLERTGYRVLTSVDGRDAVELFRTRAEQISMVLLDLMMPQMNGEEALRTMRAIRPDLPAVIMSGYDEQELTKRFTGLGPISFLQKPFSAQTLYHCVEQALAGVLPDV